jgi:hypothetical protein
MDELEEFRRAGRRLPLSPAKGKWALARTALSRIAQLESELGRGRDRCNDARATPLVQRIR